MCSSRSGLFMFGLKQLNSWSIDFDDTFSHRSSRLSHFIDASEWIQSLPAPGLLTKKKEKVIKVYVSLSCVVWLLTPILGRNEADGEANGRGMYVCCLLRYIFTEIISASRGLEQSTSDFCAATRNVPCPCHQYFCQWRTWLPRTSILVSIHSEDYRIPLILVFSCSITPRDSRSQRWADIQASKFCCFHWGVWFRRRCCFSAAIVAPSSTVVAPPACSEEDTRLSSSSL